MQMPQWAANDGATALGSNPEAPLDDAPLLDAYSGAVVGALERVAPAVTFIEVAAETRAAGPRSRRPQQASGSGFCLRRTGICSPTVMSSMAPMRSPCA